MSRFKQVWSSFRRKDQGFGMIETALFLPILLMFVFAVMDFGNYMIVKNRVVSATNAIATAIENNPTMTTSAYNDFTSQLSQIIASNMGNMTNKAGTSIAIWTSKDVPKSPIDGAIPGTTDNPNDSNYRWKLRNLQNPWLTDADPSNDNKPYYVGVYIWRANPWLTPLPRLLNLGAQIDSDNAYGDAPYGRKAADAFVVVTLNNASCPANQVLQSMTGGTATCVDKDNSGACAAGQVVTGITNGVPTCGAAPMPATGVFGGMYTKANIYWIMDAVCTTTNPLTGACSCPDFAPMDVVVGQVPMPVPGSSYALHYCYK